MSVEFIDASQPGAEHDGAPVALDHLRNQRLAFVVAAVVLVVAGAATVITEDSGAPPSPERVSETQQRLELIAAIAQRPIVGNGIIVTGVGGAPCPSVRVGSQPPDRAVKALRSILPRYRLMDYVMTLEQSGGVCSMQVRAHDADGTVVVLQTFAPTPNSSGTARTDVHVGTHGTQYARFVAASGWSVIAGASGKTHQPSSSVLTRLARDARLRW